MVSGSVIVAIVGPESATAQVGWHQTFPFMCVVVIMTGVVGLFHALAYSLDSLSRQRAIISTTAATTISNQHKRCHRRHYHHHHTLVDEPQQHSYFKY
jgi:hypothetical protein